MEDNYADGQPSSNQQDPSKTQLKDYPRRVPFLQREANGHQAFFNYMPRSRYKGDRDRIYEEYRLGKLVDLLMTDERQYRDRQPCDDEQLAACADADAPRTMLGARQLEWFKSRLVGAPTTWKVWATELMVMATRLAPGVPAQVDAWDGYGYERKQILDHILDNNVQNVVAITGDIHTFFAGTAYTTGDQATGRAAMPEFVGGSATSTGLPESTGLPPSTLAALATVNPHIKFYRLRQPRLRRHRDRPERGQLPAEEGGREDAGRIERRRRSPSSARPSAPGSRSRPARPGLATGWAASFV